MSEFALSIAERNAASDKWFTDHVIEPFSLAFGAVAGLSVMWALITLALAG